MHPAHRRRLLNIGILMSILPVACAPNFRANLDTSMQNKIIWPGPPEKPRIRYLWSLYSLLPEGSSVLDLLAGKYDFYDGKYAPVLVRPMSVYRRADILYVADAGAQRVTVINLKTLELFNVGIEGKGELSFPVSVVADREGNIYVSDTERKNVYKYDPKGGFLKTLLSGDHRPVGLAYNDDSDTLYIADTVSQSILAIDREGTLRFSIGKRGEGEGEFNYPTYLWIDNAGRLYVSDTLNARIQIFDRSGKFLSHIGGRGSGYGELGGPKGVAVDTYGNIYVVDSRLDTVKIFDRTGRILLLFGEEGVDAGKLSLPNGIFIDKDNTIYVADTYNMRIQAFSLIKGDE